MPRVVPSQVFSFITSISLREYNDLVSMNEVGPAQLSAILDLVEQIPDELLTMDNETYGSLIRAKAQIREIPATWTSNRNAGFHLQAFQFSKSQNPLAHIRDAFAKCADESPAPGTSELNFIADEKLRTNLRNDIGPSIGPWRMASGRPPLSSAAPQSKLCFSGHYNNAQRLTLPTSPRLLPNSQANHSISGTLPTTSKQPSDSKLSPTTRRPKPGSRKTSETSFTPAANYASVKGAVVPRHSLPSLEWSTSLETSRRDQNRAVRVDSLAHPPA